MAPSSARRLKHAASVHVERLEEKPPESTYVGLENVEPWSARLLLDQPVESTEGGVLRFRAGDVLFGKLRPYLAKVARPDFDGVCSTEFLVLRPQLVTGDYLRYALLNREFIAETNSWTFGTKMPRVSPGRAGGVHIFVPPVDEQQGIVRFLDEQTAKIDSLTGEKERLAATLAEEAQSFLAATLWPNELPRDWTMTPLMRVTKPNRPIMYGIVLPGPDVPEGVPLVKGGDVTNNRMHPDLLNRTAFDVERPYARARLQAGDVLLTIRGRYADAAVVPRSMVGANITQDIARVSPRDGIDSRWLLRVLQSRPIVDKMLNEAVGAAVKGVNIRDVKRYRVPLPPHPIQVALATEVDERLRAIEEARTALARTAKTLREYREAVIAAAVTGRIDVRPAG